jgi:hypothetical protein
VPTSYEVAAASLGEVRVYLQTAEPVVTDNLRSVLAYAYSHQRDHRNAYDPWESAFGDARQIESEVRFDIERERVVSVLRAQPASHWEADVLYYARGQAQALYHWSSSQGTLHPYRTITE